MLLVFYFIYLFRDYELGRDHGFEVWYYLHRGEHQSIEIWSFDDHGACLPFLDSCPLPLPILTLHPYQ